MVWNTPVTPVPGQVITTAWAQGTIIDNLAHLRVMTGNADPPGTGYVPRSTSSTGVLWQNYDGDLATKMNIASTATSTIGAGTNSGFWMAGSPADGPLGTGVGLWNYITARYSDGSLFQIAGSIANNANIPDLYYRLVTGGTPSSWAKMWHSANDGIGSGLDADLLDGADSTYYATAAGLAAVNQVPSGMIAAFRTAAAIPAGWTRFTDGDGRMLVGAGTTFSQTFTENTAVGANWTPFAGSGSLFTGTAADTTTAATGAAVIVSSPTHQHSFTVAAQTWVPVARVVVHAIKT